MLVRGMVTEGVIEVIEEEEDGCGEDEEGCGESGVDGKDVVE